MGSQNNPNSQIVDWPKCNSNTPGLRASFNCLISMGFRKWCISGSVPWRLSKINCKQYAGCKWGIRGSVSWRLSKSTCTQHEISTHREAKAHSHFHRWCTEGSHGKCHSPAQTVHHTSESKHQKVHTCTLAVTSSLLASIEEGIELVSTQTWP